jgi:hypothetical protein
LEKARADPTSDQPRAFLNGTVVDALCKYRASCSAQSPRGQLILPEALKTLPVYALGMLKHPALFENRPQSLPQAMAAQLTQPQSLPQSPGPSPYHKNLSHSPGDRFSSYKQLSSSPGSSPRSNALSNALSPAARAHYLSKVTVRGCERAFELQRVLGLPVKELINSVYPRLYCLLPMLDGHSHLDLQDEDDGDGAWTSDCDSPDSTLGSPRRVRVGSPRTAQEVAFPKGEAD